MPGPFCQGQIVAFERDQARYLGKVLRLKEGAHVGLFNEIAGEWRGALKWQGKQDAAATIIDQVCAPETDVGPILAFAPIKKTPLEWLCIKATELGVRGFQPLMTAYTQGALTRLERLQILLKEAAEQSERCTVPALHPPRALREWLKDRTGPVVVAAEAGKTMSAQQWIANGEKPQALLIGPEGGFSPTELEAFAAHPHVTCLNLGPRILKAETAGLSLLTIAQLAHGDFMDRPGFRS